MAKKRAATAPAFDPVVVRDPYSLIRGEYLGKWFVLGRTFCGYRAIGRQVHMDGVTPGVVHRTISDSHWRQYNEDENIACTSFLAGIKEEMLAHGATELAVQWAIDFEPTLFSEKELNIMAEKLQKKTPAKKAPAKAKGGGKGNPEAFAKAREAQASKKAEQLADKRKITLTDKGKEKVKKGGESGAVQNLTTMSQAKTVGKAIEAGLTMADINYAVKSGTIEDLG